MSRIKDVLPDLRSTILEISERSRAKQIAMLIAYEEDRFCETCRTSNVGKAEFIQSHHNQVFRIASLGKVYIAAAACLMIDVLSADPAPTNVYHRLKGAWDRPFTAMFNQYSKGSKIASLRGDPDILHLLLHYRGVHNTNHLIFSPDGSLMQSEEDFLETISQYTEDTNDQGSGDRPWSEYSNSNYILIALFLDAFLKSTSDMSLGTFLKEKIFKPLEMDHTYLSSEDLRRLPDEHRLQPYVVSSNGVRRKVIGSSATYGHFNAIEFCTLGPYSSIYDQGRFFGAVNSALYGKPTGDMGVEFATSFFKSRSSIIKGEATGYTRCGLFTTSDTTYAGINSLNRLMNPSGEAAKYALGRMEDGHAIDLHYMQGSATGWASTVYFAPEKGVFVIVLTNTSGLVDVTDIISRLCLQEIFDLRPSRNGKEDYKCRPNGWKTMSPIQRRRATYVELCDLMIKENAVKLALFEQKDLAEDTEIAKCGGVCGTYYNARYRQYLKVEFIEDRLRMRLKTLSGPEWSNFFRFVRNDIAGRICYRICSMYTPSEDTYRGIGIDCFGAWENLVFQAERVDGVVTDLSRKGLRVTDHFIRESDSL